MTSETPDRAAKFRSGAQRPTGFIIVSTLLGGSIGRTLAVVEPVAEFKYWAYLDARSETCEYLIPFVLAGCFLGLLTGVVAERQFKQALNPRWRFIALFTLILGWVTGILVPPFVPP